MKSSKFVLSGCYPPGLRRAILSKGVPVRFRIEGCSMRPFIIGGDVVTVAPVPIDRLRLGDTVVFAHGDRAPLVAHRLVAIRGDASLIKGDNCATSDGLIPKSKILGQVTRVERRGRALRVGLGPERLLIALLSRAGLLSMALAPARKLYRVWGKLRICDRLGAPSEPGRQRLTIGAQPSKPPHRQTGTCR